MAIDFTKINEKNIGKLFDPSVLAKNSTEKDIREGAKMAVKYNTMSFVVSAPYYLPVVCQELEGTDVLPCTCIDFPFGASLGSVKAFEVEKGVKMGAKAFDIVMNIGALQDKNFDVVKQDLLDCQKAAEGNITKIIMDIDFLTEEQIKDGTKMIVEAGCDYAKTSSGQFHGPTLEQFLAMKSVCEGTKTKTKVAGVKFPRPQNAYVFLLAGTDLIGTRAAGPMIDALQQMRDLGIVPKYKG